MYFTLSLVKEICRFGDVQVFGEFYKLGDNLLLLNVENEKNQFAWLLAMEIVLLAQIGDI